MATITVMKNFIMKKAQGSSDKSLKDFAKLLKNYGKLDVATKKQVSVATEKLYTKLKSEDSKPSTRKAPAKKGATKKRIATQDLKSILAKFKAKVGAKAYKEAVSGTTIKQDAERPALKKGKRFVTKKGYTTNQYGTFKNQVGTAYWENRANRFDVKQPAKTFPKLAKGGYLGKSEEDVWNNWSVEQRKHFLKDHRILISKAQEHGISLYRYDELPKDVFKRINEELIEHISEGQYAKGGKFMKGHQYGLGGKVSDIDSEIATNDLKEEVKSKMKKDDDVIHFAYTDYGGDFLDKVAIEYFEENYPKNIVVENTGWNGKNAFVFGKPATEWIESSENYILGFDDLESYYSERQNEEEVQGFKYFLNDLRMSYQFDKEEVMDWLMENRGGYYSVTTQGLDFSTSDLIDDLENEGLITKSNEYAKGGITEHGLKVGDKIKSGKVIGTTILVEDSNGEYARVDLNKGIRTKVEWDSKTKKYIDKK